MAVTKDEVVSFIDSMTVLEMSEFVKELEGKYGVTAAAPAAAPSHTQQQCKMGPHTSYMCYKK